MEAEKDYFKMLTLQEKHEGNENYLKEKPAFNENFNGDNFQNPEENADDPETGRIGSIREAVDSIIATVEDTLNEFASESEHPLTTESGSVAAISEHGSLAKKITDTNISAAGSAPAISEQGSGNMLAKKTTDVAIAVNGSAPAISEPESEAILAKNTAESITSAAFKIGQTQDADQTKDSIVSVNESLVKTEEIDNDYASLNNTGAESDRIGMNSTFDIPDKSDSDDPILNEEASQFVDESFNFEVHELPVSQLKTDYEEDKQPATYVESAMDTSEGQPGTSSQDPKKGKKKPSIVKRMVTKLFPSFKKK